MSSFENFKITYKLKQQTPIIHFQHDQKGATLRASEVKPKLDKFILKNLEKENKSPEKEWFIKDTKALNYKMRFFAEGDCKISRAGELYIKAQELDLSGKATQANQQRAQAKKEINSMYFANMVPNKVNGTLVDIDQYTDSVKKQYKETVFYSEDAPITMEIVCLFPKLCAVIKQYLEEFFTVHNFGSRQSKGFGGFKLLSETNEKQKTTLEILQKNGYQFLYADCGTNDVAALMNHAMTVYAILKGGLNMTGWDKENNIYKNPQNYIKGYIQRQFISDAFQNGNEIGGDKAYIKRYKRIPDNFRSHQNRRHSDSENPYTEYKFMRILLGMADHYEFRHIHKGNVNVYSLGETGYDVHRFKSPITIKIIERKIFFIFDTESLQAIAGKKFYFLLNDREQRGFQFITKYSEQKRYIESNGRSLTAPAFDRTEVDTLIDNFIKYFNSKKQKLTSFSQPYSYSANITLIRGGLNERNQ